MNYVELRKDKIDVTEVSDLVADSSCGAISIFAGTTRDNFEGKKVTRLEYEAYEPMALKTMTKICEDLRSKWPDIKHVVIYHRLGEVPVKEVSVVVAVSSPHRQTSLTAVEYAIEELKRSVPIWKKEYYQSEVYTWKENKESTKSQNTWEKGISKRYKLDFDACNLAKAFVPKNFVQIWADENEIRRRINCFIEKKREEIDLNNVIEFTTNGLENKFETETCARIDSTIMKQKDSKGYLKVQRVKNDIGPHYTSALDKLMENSPSQVQVKEELSDMLSVGVTERLENAEKHLKISTNSSRNIYERLKTIEDRILFLETVSPEYHHFLNPSSSDVMRKVGKKVYSVQDIDIHIEKLKSNKKKCTVESI